MKEGVVVWLRAEDLKGVLEEWAERMVWQAVVVMQEMVVQ